MWNSSRHRSDTNVTSVVRIISVEICIENGISKQKSISETAIKFDNMKVVDIAFLDDHRLLVLRDLKGNHPH